MNTFGMRARIGLLAVGFLGCLATTPAGLNAFAVAGEIVIGTGTSAWNKPLSGEDNYVRTQTIYLAGEIGGPCTITGLALDISSTENRPFRMVTIRVKHTGLSAYGDSPEWESADWTVVCETNQTPKTAGWAWFNFAKPFFYDGTQNLVVDFAAIAGLPYAGCSCRCSTPGGKRSIYCQTYQDLGDPQAWAARSPEPYVSYNVPNIILHVQPPNAAELPSFAPDGGVYSEDQQVRVTCGSPSAVIHYTTDGREPTENDPSIASGATILVTVSPPTMLMARAFAPGAAPSLVKTATYRQRARVYVSFAGDDANDGLTWATSKRTVQAGLDAATTGDEVWVAAGTYVETILLRSGVQLLGGFAGNETERSQRNWGMNTTTLDGNRVNGVVTVPSETDPATRIDGFTIRNGYAWSGAGILSCGSFTVANSSVETNEARISGGGIYCSYANPTIVNNTIAANTGHTAAIGCYRGAPVIVNCTVVGNDSPSWSTGGVISCTECSPTIANTIVAFNSWGISLYKANAPVLRSNCVYGNAGGNYLNGADPTGTNGNLSADPRFASWSCGNLHLQPDSPCVHTGDDAAAGGEQQDIDGQPRFAGAHVDIGADESDGTVWPTDSQAVVRVASEGDDANDGSSWGLAKRTVQAAISMASVSRGEVWVKAGTYSGPLTVPSFVHVYGGFAGTETQRNQRDWHNHVTTLNGKLTTNSNPPNVCRIQNIVTFKASWRTATIDGFTIRDGETGIKCQYCSPTIANNTIEGNIVRGIACEFSSPTITDNRIARNGTTQSSAYGGGIFATRYSSPTVSNNLISNNMAAMGAGIYCTDQVNPVIVNNRITSNIAWGDTGGLGGGVYLSTGPQCILANNVIDGNRAVDGGGIYCSDSLSPTMTNNTITGNVANTLGGGGVSYRYGAPNITNSIVAFNSSGIRRFGGTSAPIMRNNCVFGNAAFNYTGVTDPTGTDGNLSADPLLADLVHGVLRIQPDSPCVDAGSDSAVLAGWPDMDGQPRILGAHVDIGADESDGTAWTQGPYVVVRVSPEGSDANDGTTWANAKRTVQAAMDAAAIQGGEVWVKAGTYNEAITVRSYGYLYGGFAGTETQRDQRDWRKYIVILDGQEAGSVVTIAAGLQAGVVDGFTIRNGTGIIADGQTYGGGIYCGSSATIANNTITENTASLGGGIYVGFDGAASIIDNIIRENRADFGGGICLPSGSPAIQGNKIIENSATEGGGIDCRWDSTPTIANNAIVGNSSSSGGGVRCANSARPLIENNTIVGNRGADGVIAIYGSSSPIMENTIVAFNTTGIHLAGTGSPTLRYNCVFGNTDYGYSGLADPTGTDGNISADPRLANLKTYGNVHLLPDSPCIDAGDDATVQPNWPDIDGQARIAGGHVDIGADESDGTAWTEGPYVIVRVRPDGNDDEDGSSWELAKKTVQAAIEAASAVGGEVWVKNGPYPERITVHPYAYVYGGFAGTEMRLDQRDWHTNTTILDGRAGGAVVTFLAGDKVSRIDGFTIQNGTGYFISKHRYYAQVDTWLGGGVYCGTAAPTIANCTVVGNGAQLGGGIFSDGEAAPSVSNCVIASNTAQEGGGIWCININVVNCTITGNKATTPNKGGAVNAPYAYQAVPLLTNTIIAFNSSSIFPRSGSVPVLRHCCVYGNTEDQYPYYSRPEYRNINVAPLFVRTPTAGADGQWATADDDPGDLHLKAGSPCIDAGDNNAVPAGVLTDLGGVLRFFDDPATPDTDLGTAPIVDMGAYEYVPGDFDRDGDIDADDMKAFAACVSGPAIPYTGDCAGADFDKDGDVDQSDFGFIQRCFSGAGKAVDPACTR